MANDQPDRAFIDEVSAASPIAESPVTNEKSHSWRHGDVHEIPKNNMVVVMIAIMLVVLLVAMDQTVVAVSLPAMINDLGDMGSGYSWVGTAYLLTSACLAQLYGKTSDVVGRKPLLYIAIVIFLLGSVLCATAKTFLWLVLARGVQGIGGAGIASLHLIVIADITPLETRSRYSGLLSVVWGFATVVGPLVGGILTDKASWRYIFWLNLPIGAITLLLLSISLKLNPVKKMTFREHLASFDFIGQALIAAGIALLLFGFHSAESSWKSVETIVCLAVGGVLLLLCGVYESWTTRAPVIPPRLFGTRTTAGLLLCTFFQAFLWFGPLFFAPVYFQSLGASATRAGVLLIPFALSTSFVGFTSSQVVAKMQAYRPTIWFGWCFAVLGQGLISLLNEKSSLAMQVCLFIPLAIGAGSLYQSPLMGIQAAMPHRDMATATSTFSIIRLIGGTVALSIGSTILSSESHRRLSTIGLGPDVLAAALADVRVVSHIEPESLRHTAQRAYAESISTIWLVWTGLAALGLLVVLPIRAYPMQRQAVHTSGATAASNDRSSPGSTLDEPQPANRSEQISEKPLELEPAVIADLEMGNGSTINQDKK